MALKRMCKETVGVVGAGKFGTTVANLLAPRADVLLYARREEIVDKMRTTRQAAGHAIAANVMPTAQLQEVVERCQVLFLVVPSGAFQAMMQQLAPLLQAHHLVIHCTKGLVASRPWGIADTVQSPRTSTEVMTMSKVIQAANDTLRIGCLAGPNLAYEIAQGQPAAAVIASPNATVVATGQRLLQSDRFQVYGSTDLIGTELCGALKNVIAIGAGYLSGLGYGENAKALLVSRGLAEMIRIGRAMGVGPQSFLGLAGVGDLVATCASGLSRNYTVGYQLAQGKPQQQVLQAAQSTAEGINTTQIIQSFLQQSTVHAPITTTIYRILFEENIAIKAMMQEALTAHPEAHFNIM